jgi:hypothetical protein
MTKSWLVEENKGSLSTGVKEMQRGFILKRVYVIGALLNDSPSWEPIACFTDSIRLMLSQVKRRDPEPRVRRNVIGNTLKCKYEN